MFPTLIQARTPLPWGGASMYQSMVTNLNIPPPPSRADFDQLQQKINKLESESREKDSLIRSIIDLAGIKENELKWPHVYRRVRKISSTLHIHNVEHLGVKVDRGTWGRIDSHIESIAELVGGLGHVDNIYQLPQRGNNSNFGVNIIFKDERSRAMGVQVLRSKHGDWFQPQFCTRGYPELQHQIRAISTVMRELKNTKRIAAYRIQNIGAVGYGEGVIPLVNLQFRQGEKFTDKMDSPTWSLYKDGFSVPCEDTQFVSMEFQQLKQHIYQYVREMVKNVPSKQIYRKNRSSESLKQVRIDKHHRIAPPTINRGSKEDVGEVEHRAGPTLYDYMPPILNGKGDNKGTRFTTKKKTKRRKRDSKGQNQNKVQSGSSTHSSNNTTPRQVTESPNSTHSNNKTKPRQVTESPNSTHTSNNTTPRQVTESPKVDDRNETSQSSKSTLLSSSEVSPRDQNGEMTPIPPLSDVLATNRYILEGDNLLM